MQTGHGRQKVSIKTFVFMDLEGTGLFPEEPLNPLYFPQCSSDNARNTSNLLETYILSTPQNDAPRITEISLVSVSRNQIENAINQLNLSLDVTDKPLTSNSVRSIVRLPCDIHTRQVNPQLDERGWNSYELRRIRNKVFHYSRSNLEEKNTFAVEWEGVKLFLEHLPKPVCILAHNGIKYDFRVLYAEFSRAGLLNLKPIPPKVYFVDSYIMFVDVEKKLHDEVRLLTECVDWKKVTANSRTLDISCSLFSETMEGTSRDLNNQREQSLDGQTSSQNMEETVRVNDMYRYKQYETPCKQSLKSESHSEPAKLVRRRLSFEISGDHPLHYVKTSRWSPAKKIRLEPNFFRRSSEGEWEFDNHFALQYFTKKGVFRLEDMYYQLTKRRFNAHFAQDDCEALLQICLFYGKDFLD